MHLHLPRKALVITGTATSLLGIGGAAGAAITVIPVSSGVIYGCYATRSTGGSHTLVLQDKGTSCRRGETAIQWNQVVLGCQVHGDEVAVSQRLQEQGLDTRPGFAGQQVASLGYHRRWDEQLPSGLVQLVEQLDAGRMISIVGKRGGDEWGRYRRRSRRAAESVSEQILRAGRHIRGPALAGAEPRWWPGPVFDRAEVAAHVIEHRGHLVFGELLDQAEQLLTLRAHGLSVRRSCPIGVCVAVGVATGERPHLYPPVTGEHDPGLPASLGRAGPR